MGDPRTDLLERIVDNVARDGLGDRSLRDIALAVGSSHRMVLYHFGSREGLVEAIVAEVEARQRALMSAGDAGMHPADVVRDVWRRVSEPSMRPFVQLFFEAAAYSSRRHDVHTIRAGGSSAMIGDRGELTETWIDEAVALAARAGHSADVTGTRLGIAVIRGLLVDVLAGGDLQGATESLERFLELWSPQGRR